VALIRNAMADNFLERHRRDYEQRKQKYLQKNAASRLKLYRQQYDDR